MEEVKLVWITPEAEKTIQYCARVSNPQGQDKDNPKLLKYCLDNGHFSVFEMASMCIEINTSRAIARQILRHRSFQFQEFSQRYSAVFTLDNNPIVSEARRQDLKNRQNSTDDLDEETKDWFQSAQVANWDYAQSLYDEALMKGIAKECARVFLPEGQTPSRMYMSGSVRSWIHYVQLRAGNGTQKEHQEVAEQIKAIFKKELPVISTALGW